MYEIEFTPEALEDLKALKKFEQKGIIEGIEIQLTHAPTKQTRNRKKLRPNDVAEWELRIGKFRDNVYDEQLIVSIEAVGLKIGNLLFFRGKERKL
jgi:mRNA-degrading endonuclease RelE of RelBE toxin-antitoxin system